MSEGWKDAYHKRCSDIRSDNTPIKAFWFKAGFEARNNETDARIAELEAACEMLRIKYRLTCEEYHKLKRDFNSLGEWSQSLEKSLRYRRYEHGSYEVEQMESEE